MHHALASFETSATVASTQPRNTRSWQDSFSGDLDGEALHEHIQYDPCALSSSVHHISARTLAPVPQAHYPLTSGLVEVGTMSHRGHDHYDGHGHDHDHDEHDHSHDLTPALQSNLYKFIDFDKIVTLNEAEPGLGAGIVKKTWAQRLDESPQLWSDADEQLLMHVPSVEPRSEISTSSLTILGSQVQPNCTPSSSAHRILRPPHAASNFSVTARISTSARLLIYIQRRPSMSPAVTKWSKFLSIGLTGTARLRSTCLSSITTAAATRTLRR